MRRWLIAMLGLVACKRGPERPEIELVLGLGGQAPQGFRCVGPTGPLMGVDAICDGARCRYALMIDIVDMGPAAREAPSCRPLELRAWCNDPELGCATLDDMRVCRDVTFQLSDAVVQCERLIEGIENVEQALITTSAPDRLVHVRAVAMRGGCADYGYDPTSLEPAAVVMTAAELYQVDDLLGCAQSCPVVLDNWLGPLALELDVGLDACTLDTVRKCAVGELDPVPAPTCGD